MKAAVLLFLGFASGIAVAAGIFAFIAAIGIVPRMARRSGTKKFLRLYEDSIVLGGVFGTLSLFLEIRLPPVSFLAGLWAFAVGIFMGTLAMALAETLNVMPVLMRRVRLLRGLPRIITSFALGKVFGSLLYFLAGGFYHL